MDIRLVFTPITSLRVDAICTRLEVRRGGHLNEDWQDASANTPIIEAAGMSYHDQVIHRKIDPELRPRFFVRGDRLRHKGEFNHVIFHVCSTDDTDSQMWWMREAENNSCMTIAMPVTVGPNPYAGLLDVNPQEWLRNQVRQFTANTYLSTIHFRTTGMLRTVYVAFEPRFQVFSDDINRAWQEGEEL